MSCNLMVPSLNPTSAFVSSDKPYDIVLNTRLVHTCMFAGTFTISGIKCWLSTRKLGEGFMLFGIYTNCCLLSILSCLLPFLVVSDNGTVGTPTYFDNCLNSSLENNYVHAATAPVTLTNRSRSQTNKHNHI